MKLFRLDLTSKRRPGWRDMADFPNLGSAISMAIELLAHPRAAAHGQSFRIVPVEG